MEPPTISGDSSVRAGRLSELEATIERGMDTFIEVGHALHEIREQRFYRDMGYSRFEDYCQERWGWGRRQANRFISAAKAVSVLSAEGEEVSEEAEMGPIGPTSVDPRPFPMPANEAQARELSRLGDDSDAMHRVWNEMLFVYGEEEITATRIRSAVDLHLERQAQGEAVSAYLNRPDGAQERERGRLAEECLRAVVRIRRRLVRIDKDLQLVDPDVHLPVLDQVERPEIEALAHDLRAWADRIDRKLNQPIHIVRDDHEQE